MGFFIWHFSATSTILHDAQLKVDERLQGTHFIVEFYIIIYYYIFFNTSSLSYDGGNFTFALDNIRKIDALQINESQPWKKFAWNGKLACPVIPSTTSRARLHAETIAEILNGFLGPFQLKRTFYDWGTVLILVLFNAAFYFGRHSQQSASPTSHRNPMEFSQSLSGLTGSHFIIIWVIQLHLLL